MPDATNPREDIIVDSSTDCSYIDYVWLVMGDEREAIPREMADAIEALAKDNASLREQRERILARQKDYESALTRACERGDTYKSEYERLLEQRKRVLELCDELVYYGAELGRQKRRYVRVSKIRAALEEKP